MQGELIIVRYGEIGIKSPKIRGKFERKLIDNIKTVIDDPVKLNQGRIFIYPSNLRKTLKALQKIVGIVSYSPASVTRTDCDLIKTLIQSYIGELVDNVC